MVLDGRNEEQELALPSLSQSVSQSSLGFAVAPDRLSSCILGASAAGRHEEVGRRGGLGGGPRHRKRSHTGLLDR